MRIERIGDTTLYLGDCREIVPSLPRPAALIGDPPYGQAVNTNIVGKFGVRTYGSLGKKSGHPPGEKALGARLRAAGAIHSTGLATQYPDGLIGDKEPFDPTEWLSVSDIVLLWGAHKYHSRLPDGSWILWDKVPTGKVRDQGDGEAAWINNDPPRPLRIYRLLWDGVCVGSAARHEVTSGQSRVHPTQKPVALMAWCIDQAQVPASGVIMDPWMGSGSTGVACVQKGYPFVGIEIEPIYFDIACRRIIEAQRQPDMFITPAPSQRTPDIFEATS